VINWEPSDTKKRDKMRDMRGLGILIIIVAIVCLADGYILAGVGLVVLGLFFLFFDVLIYKLKLMIWFKEHNKNNSAPQNSSPRARKPQQPRK
jgi:hypothetical protein